MLIFHTYVLTLNATFGERGKVRLIRAVGPGGRGAYDIVAYQDVPNRVYWLPYSPRLSYIPVPLGALPENVLAMMHAPFPD